MQRVSQCTRLVSPIAGGRQLCLVGKVVQHRTRAASHATTSSEKPFTSVPQQVNSTLQHRQSKVADLAGKLQTAEPTQQVVKEVLQEFQCLSEQVQQLAQHMAEVDNKAQAKAAEKALKKERKAAEKALKKERKEAEKAAKRMGKEQEFMVSSGFTDEPESESTTELHQAVVGISGGDTVVDSKQLGSDMPQQGGQLASATPASTSGVAPAAVISVCQGKSCQKQGSAKLLHYIQATAGDELDVVPCKCLGKCEQGPNLRVSLPEQKPVLHTSLQNGQEVKSILQGTKAQYGSDVMKSFAAA